MRKSIKRGKADAMTLIARWQAEASAAVAAALAGLALAVADRDAMRPATGEDGAAPQQLRQDW